MSVFSFAAWIGSAGRPGKNSGRSRGPGVASGRLGKL